MDKDVLDILVDEFLKQPRKCKNCSRVLRVAVLKGIVYYVCDDCHRWEAIK